MRKRDARAAFTRLIAILLCSGAATAQDANAEAIAKPERYLHWLETDCHDLADCRLKTEALRTESTDARDRLHKISDVIEPWPKFRLTPYEPEEEMKKADKIFDEIRWILYTLG